MFQGLTDAQGLVRMTTDIPPANQRVGFRGFMCDALGQVVVQIDAGQTITGRVNGLPLEVNGALLVDNTSGVDHRAPGGFGVNPRGALVVEADVTPSHYHHGVGFAPSGALAVTGVTVGDIFNALRITQDSNQRVLEENPDRRLTQGGDEP